jgi:hypothetical protein
MSLKPRFNALKLRARPHNNLNNGCWPGTDVANFARYSAPIAPLLHGATPMHFQISQEALMKKFLAILGLIALALTGGLATVNALISPPAAHDRNC